MDKTTSNRRQRFLSVAIAFIALLGLLGCGEKGGGSGSSSEVEEPPTELRIESVQTGLPMDLSTDDGSINGTVYPVNSCESFIAVNSSDPTERMGIWLKVNVSGAEVSHYEWEIVDWSGAEPFGELSGYDEAVFIDPGIEKYRVRSANDCIRYECVSSASISNKHLEFVKVTAWTEGGYFATAYFKINVVSNDRFFVVGDSTSHRTAWPGHLEPLSSRHTFSQAIGSSASPSMVYRARGVEPAYPLEGVHSVEPGSIQLRWHRHIADRTQNEIYRRWWAEYAKAVSEPDAVEVYEGESFVGYAERVLKPFSTSNELSQTRIYCDDHGLADGDHVAFVGNDPEWPSDISVRDAFATWNFSSGQLPINIVERRVYFATNIESNSFEVKEFESDAEPMDLDGDAMGSVLVECGWRYDFEYGGGALDIGWRPRTKYDDLIWLLMVSANDIPGGRAAEVTIPNTEMLLDQMSESNQRFILVCPPSGSYESRGPGSKNWVNYYDTYMPWVYTTYPDNHVDTMEVLGVLRSQAELNLLSNPEFPELLWISGSPSDESSWMASPDSFDGASQKWVGPGYIPLQFRASLSDGIHLNVLGNQVLAEAVLALLNEKGW